MSELSDADRFHSAIAGFIMTLTPLSCTLMGWRGAGGSGAANIGTYFFFGGLLMILGATGEVSLALLTVHHTYVELQLTSDSLVDRWQHLPLCRVLYFRRLLARLRRDSDTLLQFLAGICVG